MVERKVNTVIVIAWHGLPIYACNVIRAFRARMDVASVHIITQLDNIPYASREAHLGTQFIQCLSEDSGLTWSKLGLPIPQVLFVTSWNHRGYNALAREVKRSGGSVVLMTDNIFHGSLKQYLGAIWFRLCLRKRYDAAFVPGIKCKQFLQFLGMPKDAIRIGLYAGDPAIFRDDGRQKNGEFVFVGQLIERKGIKELVGAAKRLGILSRITFYGDGDLREWMHGEGCRIHGFIQPEELGEVLRSFSILLLPSRLDHWGVALHEGALAGCSLIASDKTGAAFDLINDRHNGCIFLSGNSAALEASLKWVLDQPTQWWQNARLLSVQKAMAITPENWAIVAEEICEKLLNKKLSIQS
jgi:glycosyltransferase involved in cell wall biosynthesis